MVEEKRVIQEEDIERIMHNAPDYILDAADEVKDLWVAAEWAKEERDLTPKRYYEVVLFEGEDKEKRIEIDFQQTLNPGTIIKAAGGSLTDVRSVNAKRLAYQRYEREYQRLVKELNKAIGARAHRSRNIVDYTGNILELFGKFYTVTDVAKIMAKEYRIKIPEDELKKFYVEHRDLVTRRRAEYVLQNKDFRVATETGRLEVLNQMLVEVEIKNRACGGSNVDYCNLILRIIEQARKEVKGNEIKMTVDGKIDINATIQAETNVMSVMKQMSINALVIGLTAAKAGLNPAVLIAQLANSWYARFNGFNNNVMDGVQVQLPSALIKQYDWDIMAKQTKQFVNDFTPITEVIEEPDEVANQAAETKRKRLLEQLKAMKMAKHTEDAKANAATPDSLPTETLQENGLVLAAQPVDEEEPAEEFDIDYNARKQKKGMRIKGKIKESVARHKAKAEAEKVDLTAAELAAKERRKARRAARKKK